MTKKLLKKMISKVEKLTKCKVVKYNNETFSLIEKHTDPKNVEILYDEDFQKSCKEVAPYTLLDTARLANIWTFVRLISSQQRTNETGNIIEVGSYLGGGALHMSNANPLSKIYICDSFTGFEQGSIQPNQKDGIFTYDMFRDTSENHIHSLFKNKQRNYKILNGFFPASDKENEVNNISFAHIDVDIYKAVKESLLYLNSKMAYKSIIILDDYKRKASGVDQAIQEFFFLKECHFIVFPIYPSQGLLVHKSWFS